jgi:hypothetical protein
MQMKHLTVIRLLMCAAILSACDSPTTSLPKPISPESTTNSITPTHTPQAEASIGSSPTQTPQSIASILEALPNIEYPVELTSTGKAQLKDGVFEESAAPGSATKTKVLLGKAQALGDVNGDGFEDAAVILVVDPGGSGTFTYLALVLNENGTAKPVASVLLGDRITVKSMVLQSGEVKVTMLTRKPDEPMSAEPTVEVTRLFRLQDDQLVEEK